MTKAAAIMGSLVDARNVAAHKCMRLTVEIPVERALEAIEAFGWPTGVDPVPVAIARLNENAGRPAFREVAAAPSRSPTSRQFNDMPLPQQAGMLCSDPAFHKYLSEFHSRDWKDFSHLPDPAQAATFCVRRLCGGIASRRELLPDTPEAEKWAEIVSWYRAWQREPEFVP